MLKKYSSFPTQFPPLGRNHDVNLPTGFLQKRRLPDERTFQERFHKEIFMKTEKHSNAAKPRLESLGSGQEASR